MKLPKGYNPSKEFIFKSKNIKLALHIHKILITRQLPEHVHFKAN